MFKKRKFIKRLKSYLEGWSTEDHRWVHITDDGRLLPTNNVDKYELHLTKRQFEKVVRFYERSA